MRARTVGLAALFLLVIVTFVMAQPTGSDATLVVSAGQVVVNQSGGMLFATSTETAVSTGDLIAVQAGDTIHLAETASAQLRLNDGSTIDLSGGTTLSIAELVSNEVSYRARFSLLAGKTLSQVVRLLRPDDSFEIKTPSSTASVRGTRFTVEVISNEESYYAVEEGVVQVTMADQAVDVAAGFAVTAVVGQPLQVEPDEATTAPPNNTPQPDRAPTIPAMEANTAVPTNSRPLNRTTVTSVPETSTNTNDTAENGETPTIALTRDEGEDATAAATAVSPSTTAPTAQPNSSPVATSANTPASIPTSTPLSVPTDTALPAPTNTPNPALTYTPMPPPTNTPAPPTNTPALPPPTNTPTTEDKVVICHNGNTIEVDASAVAGHLAHGDTPGPCP